MIQGEGFLYGVRHSARIFGFYQLFVATLLVVFIINVFFGC
jgi:hypothetical protein